MKLNGTGSLAVEPIDHMLDNLNADTVFGEPQHEGKITVIPVAQVSYGFGLGHGYGRGGGEKKVGEATTGLDEGGGGGGGGGGSAKPQGFLRITPEDVRYEPITHPEREALAGIAMVAWAIFWIGMTIGAVARAFAKARK